MHICESARHDRVISPINRCSWVKGSRDEHCKRSSSLGAQKAGHSACWTRTGAVQFVKVE